MNSSYRSLWNAALSSWVAVPETARTHSGGLSGKSGVFSVGRPTALIAAMSAAMLVCLAPLQEAGAATVSWDPNGAATGTGGSGVWDATSLRWLNGTTLGAWNNALFDDAVFGTATAGAPAGYNVTLAGTINARSLNFAGGSYGLGGGTLNLGGANPTITGNVGGVIGSAISGSGGLIKSGPSSVTLSGVNTYTGVTQLQQGTLALNNARALGDAGNAASASNFIVSPGTTVSFNANIANNLTIAAVVPGSDAVRFGGSGTWSGTPTLQGAATVELAGGTFSGNWSDNGGVLSVTSVASQATLTGTPSYSGATSVAATGVLALGSPGALSPNSNLVLAGDLGGSAGVGLTTGTAAAPGFASFTRSLGAGGGQVRWTGDGGFYSAGPGTQTVNIGGAATPATLTWGVTPNFVAATSRLVLGSTTNGGTAGTLDFQNPLVIPGAGQTYVIDGIGGNVANHARITGQISGAGNLQVAGSRNGLSNSLIELAGNNTYTGDLILNAPGGGGNVMLGASGAASSKGGILLAGPAGSAGNTLVLTADSDNLERPLGTGAGTIRWTGNGGFSAAGGTRTVNIGRGQALTWGVGGFVPAGAWLNLAATGAGDSEIDFRNPINLNGAVRTVNAGSGGTARLSGVLSNGGVVFQSASSAGGTIVPSALNTYTGVTTLAGTTTTAVFPVTVRVSSIGNGGVAGNLGAASNAASNLVISGGILEYVGSGETSDRSFTLTGGGGTIRANSPTGALSLAGVAGTANLVLEGASPPEAINQLTGVVAIGSGSLIKRGTNTWRLANPFNTYLGATHVDMGVLEVVRLANGGAASSIGAGPSAASNLTIGSTGPNVATLRYLGSGDSTDRAITFNGNAAIESSGTAALTWTSTAPLQYTASAQPSFTLGGANTDLNVFSAAWRDSAAATNANLLESGLIKAGSGTWQLNATGQAYTGNTLISGGALYAGTATAITGGMGTASNAAPHPTYTLGPRPLPMSSLIEFNGGVLGLTAASGNFSRNLTTLGGAFINGANNGGVTPDFTDDAFVQGVKWSGSGGFAARGGNHTVNLGGAGVGVTWDVDGFVPDGSKLILGASSADSTVDFVNPIALGAVARMVQTDDGSAAVDGVLSGAMTGTGGLSKSGTGTLALTAANLYRGATAVHAGTLQLGNGGTEGTLGLGNATVAAGATIAFNRANAYSVANAISGWGTLAQIGGGTTTLAAALNAVNRTAVTGGTLDVDHALTSYSLLMGGATLNIDGSLQTASKGAVVATNVAGTNSNVNVSAGATLRLNGDLGDGNDSLTSAGTLDLVGGTLALGEGDDAMTVTGTLTGTAAAAVNLGDGSDTLTLGDGVNISGYLGAFNAGANTAAGASDTLRFNNAAAVTLAGSQVGGFESLVKDNFGVATLTGDHNYITTALNDGTLQLAAGGSLTTDSVTMDSESVLDIQGTAGAAGAGQMNIVGSAGVDTVRVGANAVLRARGDLGDGNDVLDVAGTLDIGASNVFALGAGNDTFRTYDNTVVTGDIDAGLGNDMLDVTVSGGKTVKLDGLQGFESLGKSGKGALQIHGPSDFIRVDVNDGLLDVTPTGAVTAAATFVGNGATLNLGGTYSGTSGRDTFVLAGRLSGGRAVDLGAADDTLTVNDGAQFIGGSTIVGGADVNGDTVMLNNANPLTFGNLSAPGFEWLVKSNTGVATLAGDHTYRGATIQGGTLAVRGTLDTPNIDMADGTALEVLGPNGLVQADPSGALTRIGGSSGTNTVRIAEGATLRATADLGAGEDLFVLHGHLDTGTSLFSLGGGDDTIRVYETMSVNGHIDGGAGNDMLNVHVGTSGKVPALDDLTGFESLGKSGAGTLQIKGAARDFITVDVEDGTLHIVSPGSIAAQHTVVHENGTLEVDTNYNGTAGNDTMKVAGVVKGSGVVDLQDGNDTLTLLDGADLGGLSTPIDGGAGSNTLVTDIATSATLGGITRFQTLEKTNVGTLHINGTAPADFSTVKVDGGTVSVGPQGSISGVTSTSVAAGATLNVDGSYSGSAGADTVTMAGALSGAGSVALLDGNDRFELHDSGSIAAATRVDGGAGTNAFVLTGSATASFDASRLDHGIDNFQDLRKEGTGTWRLTGTGAPTQHWSVAEGTLIGDSQSLQGNVSNQAKLVFDQAFDGVYAATLSGGGSLIKTGAGMLELTGPASAMAAGTTVEQGRLQVMGSLASPTAVELGADLGGTGVIAGDVTNAGSVSPGTLNSATAQVPKGQVIRHAMSPPGLGTLTVKGDYVSTGGQLNIRTVLGSDDSPTDRLMIDGGKGSGRTQINVTNQGGAGALTRHNGIQVVGLVNGASTNADAFNLGAPVVVGPFQYDLRKVGSEGWFLQSRDNNPVVPPAKEGQALTPEVAAASPEVSLNNSLGAMTQLYGLQTLGTWHTRHGNADEGMKRGDTHYWARGFGVHGHVQGGGLQSRGADFSYNTLGMQAGADLEVSRDGPVEDRAGGYVGFGHLHGGVKHFDGSGAGRNSMRGYSLGGYWTRTSREGWYVDAVVQGTRYDKVETHSVQGIRGRTSGWGIAASLEAGKSLPVSETVSVEPQAQLIVQHNRLGDVRDSYLNEAGLGSSNSVLGRLGARWVHTWSEAGSGLPASTSWLRLNLWQELAGRSSATYQTADGPLAYRNNMRGSWGEVELGFSASFSSNTSIFGTIGYHHSLSGTHREGSSFNVGVNTGGTAAVGLGLSTQLSRSTKLTAKASYGNGAKGQDNVATANVALDVRW